jgi:hypothetical protein
MRIPETTNRMRHGPGQALRAVFTGIGQMFLAADRLKEQVESSVESGPGQGPGGWSRESGRPGSAATRGGKAAGRTDRSRRSGSAAEDTETRSRWRSLDTTGNVRLLSAEDLALEFPQTPASAAKPRPSWGTSAEARGADGSGTLDPTTMAGGRAGWRPLGAMNEVAGLREPSVADEAAGAAVAGEAAGADEAFAAGEADEVTDVAPAPAFAAPDAPAPKTSPRTIVIVDESLSSYEAEADQASTESVTTDEVTTEQVTTDNGKTDRPTILIVDDSLIEYEDDQTAIDEASVTQASAAPAADQHTPAADTKPPADASAAYDAAVARPAISRWAPEEEPPAAEVTAFTDAAAADLSPAAYDDDVAHAEPTTDASRTDDTAPTAGPAAAEESTAAAEPAVSEADALPVPTYDSLSLPSLRSRLRNLDIDQVRALLAYERTHAARADMITMFERRIEKLANQ